MYINKFILGVGATLLTIGALQAQENNPLDISRYSDSDLNGTARFRGMSGAFGAVGGDLSALKINPAGGAIFNYNQATFSLSVVNKDNKINYLNQTTSKNYTGVDVGQVGAIFVFNSNDPSALMKKFTVGFNYESSKNLNNDYNMLGAGQSTSLGEYFYQSAIQHQVPHDILNSPNIHEGYMNAGYYQGFPGQQAFLGYEGFIINPGQADGEYTRNFGSNTDIYAQGKYVSSSGYNSKFSGNFAAQLGDRIFVGGNLNLHVVDFTQTSHAVEMNQSSLNKDMIQRIEFSNYLYTYGTGFSLNLGVIGQVTDELRAGVAYESPTWYNLHDELTQGLYTTRFNNNEDRAIYPDVVNIYDRYRLKTPAKYTGSLAYVFNKRGLISVDYGIKDHSNAKFSPKKDNTYSMLNDFYAAEMKTASELRIGAEYRVKQVSFRAGYRYEESPYKNIKYTGDLNSFSAGIGYEFGNSRLDFAYSHTARDYKTSVLDLKANDLYSYGTWKMKENWFSLSYNINF
ncbi:MULTISPECIES: outer membrane protein transport protein [unclassified Myroides]|uniref:OmpP1/FadL family transporter n=1 Tax=unclassified Myroides TaxID=2642485 RepID=UPI0015F80C23|nr:MULTISPECIES: outer membrane protein transport protein [unclassified Myroides]MBB1151198.1 outer membrane protein transport protein [Myroides sp. NP-2]MDM1408732.1 outer membrane protein transport protein [Myroides sp. DF42-4-2]